MIEKITEHVQDATTQGSDSPVFTFLMKFLTVIGTISCYLITQLISYITKNNKYKRKLSEQVNDIKLDISNNYAKKTDITDLVERIKTIEKKFIEGD